MWKEKKKSPLTGMVRVYLRQELTPHVGNLVSTGRYRLRSNEFSNR